MFLDPNQVARRSANEGRHFPTCSQNESTGNIRERKIKSNAIKDGFYMHISKHATRLHLNVKREPGSPMKNRIVWQFARNDGTENGTGLAMSACMTRTRTVGVFGFWQMKNLADEHGRSPLASLITSHLVARFFNLVAFQFENEMPRETHRASPGGACCGCHGAMSRSVRLVWHVVVQATAKDGMTRTNWSKCRGIRGFNRSTWCRLSAKSRLSASF
jgi:hypothetical protein